MTDLEYLVEMTNQTARLTDACNNFGLRSPEYMACLDEIKASAARFNRSRRRRPWLSIVLIIFLWFLLLLLVADVLYWF